jgi:hypothetical protein
VSKLCRQGKSTYCGNQGKHRLLGRIGVPARPGLAQGLGFPLLVAWMAAVESAFDEGSLPHPVRGLSHPLLAAWLVGAESDLDEGPLPFLEPKKRRQQGPLDPTKLTGLSWLPGPSRSGSMAF